MKNIRIRKSKSWVIFSSSFILTAMVSASASPINNEQNSTGLSQIQNKELSKEEPKYRTAFNKNSQEFILKDGTYQIKVQGRKLSRKRQVENLIHLRRGGSFDPLEQSSVNRMSGLNRANQARLPELYSASIDQNFGAYIVQFKTQALPDYQQNIKNSGGLIGTPFPPNSMLVLIDPSNVNRLNIMSSVRAVVPYLPIHKLQEGLENVIGQDFGDARSYSILAINKKFSSTLQNLVKSTGAQIVNSKSSSRVTPIRSSRFTALLTPFQLLQVAKSPYTLFVDELGDPNGEDIDDVRERGGFNWLESVAGYTGQGVGIEVYDRGFQVDHQELLAVPNPILIRSPAAEGSGGADHGTDISGILFGQGVDPKYRGILPDAARPIVFSRYSGFPGTNQPSESELRGHLAELVDPNGPYRAVVQTSSTDYSRTLDYTTWSAEYDEVIFDLDLVKTQSQSNNKDRMSRPAAWSKNVVAVGGIKTLSTLTRSDDGWNTGASIGPAADDRIKPDLSGQYDAFDMIADGSGSTYNARNGTSFSTPATAGAFGILFQMWADGVFDGGPGKQGAPEFRDVFDVRPHASTARALMIHTAFQYDFDTGDSHNLSRIKQGWGFPDVKNLYQSAQENNWQLPILVNEEDIILPGATNSYTMTLDGSKPLKATLVYKDPRGNPASSIARINDLSLRVTSPSGTIYWGNNGLRQGIWSTPGGNSNTIDTVENVFIQIPQAGTWQIEVLGDDIVQDGHIQTPSLDADYALVATGGVSSNTAPVVDAGTNFSIQLPDDGNLNGSVVDDAFPGTTLTTSWSVVSGPGSAVFADNSAAITTVSFSVDGTYTLRLTANDGEFNSQDDVIVSVSPPAQNLAPIVNAGSNQSIELPAVAILNASCSDDALPIGSSLSTNWSGISGVVFSNPNALSTTASFSAPGSYNLTLNCDDGQLNTNDSLVVTVVAEQTNQAPTVNIGTDINAIAGITATLSATASDDGRPFGSTLTTTWSVVSGPGSVSFSNANDLNSEVIFGSAGTYEISLTASDGSLSTSASLNAFVSEMPVELENENFEVSIGNWSNPSASDSHDWTRNSGSTPSSSTGPSGGANGSNWYMYLETSSGSGAYNAGDTAILESGELGGTNRSFSFDYHMYGSNMGTLEVQVNTNGGNWTSVWSRTGQQHSSSGEAYTSANIDLSSYVGTLKVRFLATAVGNYRGDMAVDNPVLSGLDTPPQNQTPHANAGIDQVITLPSDANLNGVCSDDGLPLGNNVSCVWSSSAGVTFANASSANTTASFSSAGSYTLMLTANDGELSSTDTVQITVNPAPANQAPIADAGGNQNVFLNDGVSLNGLCTDDGLPVPSSLSASWSGDTGVTFANVNSATTTAIFGNIGSYTVTLTCSDGELSNNNSATISVSEASQTPVLITSNDFEAGLGDWSNASVGDDENWTRDSGGTASSSTGPATGANGSNWYLYLETSSAEAYTSGETAILESVNLAANNLHVKFDYHMYGANMGSLAVDVKTAGSWTNDVWVISDQQHSSSAEAYTSVDVDLSSYAVEQIRLRATAAGNYRGDMAIDNLEIWGVEGPVAPVFNSDPLIKSNAIQDQGYNDNISADANDANGDSLTFNKISGPNWLNIASNGVLSGTPSASDLGSNSFVVEVSDGSLSSQATMTINVTDGATPVVISSSDFESGFGDWNNPTANDNYDWTRDSNGTPSSSTGPATGTQGSSYYLFMETSDGGRGAYNTGETAYLESNDFTGSQRTLTFDYHLYGVEIGTLSVDVYVNGGWVNDIWQISGQQQSSNSAAYNQANVDLSGYTGVIKIRLRGTAAGGWHGDMAIDNIVVTGVN